MRRAVFNLLEVTHLIAVIKNGKMVMLVEICNIPDLRTIMSRRVIPVYGSITLEIADRILVIWRELASKPFLKSRKYLFCPEIDKHPGPLFTGLNLHFYPLNGKTEGQNWA